MKRFITLLTLAISLVILAASCDRSYALRAIPDDTVLAIKIHPGTLIDQSGIQGNRDIEKMLRDIADKDRYSLLKKIIESPESATGIDVDQEIVIASTLEDTYLIVPLSSPKRFVSFLKETEVDVNSVSGRQKGYTHTVGYDEDYPEGIIGEHVAIFTTGYGKKASELAELILEGCSIDESSFLDFCSADEAVAIWFSIPALSDKAGSYIRDDEVMALMMLGDSYFLATVDPGRGGADMYVKAYMDKDLSNNTGSITKLVSLGSTRYFKYMPSEPMLVINAGTGNFKDIYESIPAYSKKTMGLDEMIERAGLVKDDLKGIGGPFTLAGSAVQMDYDVLPSFSFAITCKEEVVKKIAKTAGLSERNGAWHIPAGEVDLYMFAADGALVLMTADLYKRSMGETMASNLGDDQVRHKVSRASLVFNFKSKFFKPILREAMDDDHLPADLQKELLKDFALLDYAKIDYNIIGGELHLSLRTTENKYLLESIVDVVTSLYKVAR